MLKKGLVISWYFPPINSSEGLCTFKLLKNSKFKYDVFTQKNDKSWSYDTNEDKLISKNINTIFSKSKNLNDWIKEGIDYCEKNIKKYDFIMSRSMAPESHEIALETKKKNSNMLWIASFGDPIANNPYNNLTSCQSPYKVKGTGMLLKPIKYVLSPKRILKNIYWNYREKKYKKNNTRFYKDIRLQDEVLKNCDIIIFNNKYQMEYMLSNYTEKIKSKALLLYHGYDTDFYKSSYIKLRNEKYKISYLGHLDDIRTPISFLKALVRLKKNRRNLYDNLEFDIYGNMSDKDKVFLVNNDIIDVVKFKRPIKYFESLEVMEKSDLLLLIDANLGFVYDKNIFFAAKLADYIGSKSNIMGITMDNGPSYDIIKSVGGIVCSHSADDIYNNLVLILENKLDISNNDKDGIYNIKNISKKFDEEVENKIRDR